MTESVENIEKEDIEPHVDYPSAAERFKGLFLDTFIIVGFMVLISYTFSLFESVPDSVRIGAAVFVWFLYDPLFVTFFGGSLGHMTVGLRVRRNSDESKNIMLHMALLRYIVKIGLGIISVLIIPSSEKSRAIHDYISASVVVYKTR